MTPPTTPRTTEITFVVRFWHEWSGAGSRWRGRVEHVQSGRQASFLEIGDLLGFFQRFGIGGEGPPAGRSDINATPGMGEPRVVDSS